MRQNWLQIGVLLVLGAIVSVSTLQWLHNPLEENISPDEIIWTLDAEAFSWYYSGDIQQFKLTKTLSDLKWVDQEYRVIDQPQMGKYILGMLLTVRGLEPWASPQKQELYQQFAHGSLPKDLNSKLDPEILASINYLRVVSTYFSLLAFFLVGWLVYTETRQAWAGVFMYVLLTQHETIRLYYRQAVVNSYSFFTQTIAVGLLVAGLRFVNKDDSADLSQSWKKLLALGAAAGFFVAVASSIKLDGLFLVLAPYMFLLFFGFYYLVKPKLEAYVARYVVWFIGFISGGVTSFLLLEPELWSQPIQHTYLLLSSRLVQQQKFLAYFDDLTVLETMERWVQYIFKLAPVGQLLLVVVIIACLAKMLFIAREFRWQTMHQFNIFHVVSNSVLGLVLFAVWFGSLYCAEVGFDRYFILSVVVFYVGIVLFLSKYVVTKDITSLK